MTHVLLMLLLLLLLRALIAVAAGPVGKVVVARRSQGRSIAAYKRLIVVV